MEMRRCEAGASGPAACPRVHCAGGGNGPRGRFCMHAMIDARMTTTALQNAPAGALYTRANPLRTSLGRGLSLLVALALGAAELL